MEVITKQNCPYCERVDIALKLRKISSETVHIVEAENGIFPENLVTINPNKTFPTFKITSNTGFAESMVIVEYLDSINATGPKLYGDNPEDIAKTKFNLENLQNKVNKYIQWCIYTYNSVVEERKAIEHVSQAFNTLTDILENRNSRFLGGDDLNAEDVYFAPFVLRYLAVQSQNKNLQLPEETSRAGKYFHDISHHSLIRKCVPHTEELALYMKKYNDLKSLNFNNIKNSSRELVTNPGGSLIALNSNYKNSIEWQLGKDDKGQFIHTKLKFKNPEIAIKAIQLLNEIQEAANHHASFTMENFSTLKIELCTHKPKYGITEMDFSFADVFTSKVLSFI